MTEVGGRVCCSRPRESGEEEEEEGGEEMEKKEVNVDLIIDLFPK